MAQFARSKFCPSLEFFNMKFFLLLSVLLLSACATVRPTAKVETTPALVINDPALTQELATYAQSLIGTPYKYGGESPATGFDCSGYAREVFYHSVGVKLPRTTKEMSQAGQHVDTGDLQLGDLVFFDTLKKKFSHVGIYIGDDSFIHAPSKGGKVRVEKMSDVYWKNSYNGARRINVKN